MNTDLSVAPEIAQLAEPFIPVTPVAMPRTDGRIAGDLAGLAAAPQRWWDLVRFDSQAPVRVPLPEAAGTWLLIMPPGATADCDCTQATALAGEAVELAGGHAGAGRPSRPLRPGRVRVHGSRAPHRVRAAGPGYSVTLHAAVGRSLSR
ncbi:MAG TPA: cysteine dioxygenase [Trebonia sp.]